MNISTIQDKHTVGRSDTLPKGLTQQAREKEMLRMWI
jgi:hypothetical protein